MWRKDDVVEKLKEGQGAQSLRSYARSIGCSASYLSDIYLGKREPGPKVLAHLDLELKITVTKEYVKRRWR
jgi:transcriptional regulator with XRE-family HTH domain